MSRINPTSIAKAILNAPAWARVGITAPSECLREDAAQELARSIVAEVDGGWSAPHADQLKLAL